MLKIKAGLDWASAFGATVGLAILALIVYSLIIGRISFGEVIALLFFNK